MKNDMTEVVNAIRKKLTFRQVPYTCIEKWRQDLSNIVYMLEGLARKFADVV